MKIGSKIVLSMVGVSGTAVLISGLVTGNVLGAHSAEVLRDSSEQRLKTIAHIQRSVVEQYFETIRNQVLTLSNDHMIKDAMVEFQRSYRSYPSYLVASSSDSVSQLRSYYETAFGNEYKKKNNGEEVDIETMFSGLDKESIALQVKYISENPNELGKKHLLNAASDSTSYAAVHEKYHPVIRDFLDRFGYYDIFLADPETGDVIYSVHKELDFTTSLIDGPYANTGLGKAFREANNATEPNSVVLTDYAPYRPSYDDPAAFTASPIFVDGNKVGVLIFQMPLDRINQELSFANAWESVGLGKTGETYLVGADGYLRSQRRAMI